MSLPLLDVVILAAYLCGMIVFGLWLSRRVKTEKDYFLAGRSLPFWVIGMSIVVSDIGAVDFVSLGGQAYDYGIVAANMDWIGTMPAIILAAFIFVPYYWRAGVYSVPEFLGRRYNPTVRAIQSLVWTVFLVVNLGAVFWAAAKMFEGLIGPQAWLPQEALSRLWIYVFVTAAITGVYTISGGLTAVVYTDSVQLVLMFLGAFLVIGLGLADPAVGGLEGMKEAIVERGHERHFTLFLPHDSKTPYPWPGVLLGLTLVLAPAYFIGNQAIVQRTLGARDEWSAKAGTLFGGLLKFWIPFLVVLPGLIALVKYPDLADGEQGYARLVKDLLPVGIRGLVIAGFLAALMSSLDSMLTSAATLITRDLWVGLLKKKSDDRRLLRFGRTLTFALLVFGVATSGFSENFEGIYATLQTMFSIIQGPTLALLLAGMFWRRATTAGALAALVVGMGLATGLHVWQKVQVDEPAISFGEAQVFAVVEDPEPVPQGYVEMGTVLICDLPEGHDFSYRDRVQVVRGRASRELVAIGKVTLLRSFEGTGRPRTTVDLRDGLGEGLPTLSGARRFATRVAIDHWNVDGADAQKIRPGDLLGAFQPSAPFNAAEPFFYIAAIAFGASLLTLVLVSLVTTPKRDDQLLGLVYGAASRNSAAQDALSERTEDGESS